MSSNKSPGSWTVDLKSKLASCGSVMIRFSERGDHGFNIAFISGANCSLEEQCLIAGQAAAAIEAKLRWAA